jgi:hypothetical protein
MARNIEFFQQFLHRRYLVGLFIDHDMRQHQRRIDGKSAEYLPCFGIVEGVALADETSDFNGRLEMKLIHVDVLAGLADALQERQRPGMMPVTFLRQA